MSTETTGTQHRRDLVCYRDTDEAEAVCGNCGRPVCGPLMDASFGGLIRNLYTDHGHGQRFHDATFHHYESGLGRVLLAVGLLGISILFSVVVPRLIPRIVLATISTPIELKPALIQSSAIIGIALLATLRYQRGERKTSFRIRIRRGYERVLCDECFENRLVQLALMYVITGVAIVSFLLGVRNAIATSSLLPLRMGALAIGIIVIRDDLVAYVMFILESEN